MQSSFQLIDHGWDQVLGDAVATDCAELRVVCPFIKVRTARRLLASRRPERIQVITRFHLGEMCDGVNDTAALRLLLEHGAQIRGIKGLHAKLYLFGDERVIVASANLTEAALLRNHEFGFVSTQQEVVQRCREYFEALWERAGKDLDLARLEDWETQIQAVQVTGSRPSHTASLPDEGEVAAWGQPGILSPAFALRGKLTRAELETLDWPDLPWQRFEAYRQWLQKIEGLKTNTAREYAYFLTRCSTHYEVAINETAVPDEEAANRLLEQIRQVVAQRGRWAHGTFDERDVRQNLSPALRAFGRYSQNLKFEPGNA